MPVFGMPGLARRPFLPGFPVLAFAGLGGLAALRFLCLGFLNRRRLGGEGANLCRLHARDMVVKFPARRAAVVGLAVAAALLAAPATTVTVLVTARAVFFPHLDVHHLAACQLLPGDLLVGR